jgi:hypothetical protein
MLLSIDENKVRELLESSHGRYAVSTLDVPTVKIESYQSAYPTSYAASGTDYAAPVLVTAETKENLMSARHRIEESGVRLKSADELTREIDEMRGRR